jgi:hypothetical protein
MRRIRTGDSAVVSQTATLTQAKSLCHGRITGFQPVRPFATTGWKPVVGVARLWHRLLADVSELSNRGGPA